MSTTSKIVVAQYSTLFVYKVPDGIDLEDKEVVEFWGIKYGTLIIKLKGKDEQLELESVREEEPDYKYPNDVRIRDEDTGTWNWNEDSDDSD